MMMHVYQLSHQVCGANHSVANHKAKSHTRETQCLVRAIMSFMSKFTSYIVLCDYGMVRVHLGVHAQTFFSITNVITPHSNI